MHSITLCSVVWLQPIPTKCLIASLPPTLLMAIVGQNFKWAKLHCILQCSLWLSSETALLFFGCSLFLDIYYVSSNCSVRYNFSDCRLTALRLSKISVSQTKHQIAPVCTNMLPGLILLNCFVLFVSALMQHRINAVIMPPCLIWHKCNALLVSCLS